MVSKEKYYEYKSKGLCVKCGHERTNSPSDVRCADCHIRFLDAKKVKKEERLDSGVCIQCGKTALVGNSKYCQDCRDKNAAYKKQLADKPIAIFKENNQHCRVCNNPVDTLGVICQKCLDQVQFSKLDALIRYGQKCTNCLTDDAEKLTFASSDISVPMKHSGPELYRYICFSSGTSKDYIVICHTCYWTNNMAYIKGMRDIFLSANLPEEEDIIIDTTAMPIQEEEDGDEDLGDDNDNG